MRVLKCITFLLCLTLRFGMVTIKATVKLFMNIKL